MYIYICDITNISFGTLFPFSMHSPSQKIYNTLLYANNSGYA